MAKKRSNRPQAATKRVHANDEAVESRSWTSFPIVGVGASAGGLEAFSQFLEHLPLDTGMAFVLVQHLDPEHESSLSQILRRTTSLPVQIATPNWSGSTTT